MSTGASTFAATGEEVIHRPVDISESVTDDFISEESLDQLYEVEETAEEIVRGDFKRIALQFPDELLHASVPIYQSLKARLGGGRDLYVLADTSYGSCCVDEVAAQHIDADLVVHYGHACLTPTSRLPVVYVFGKKRIDVNHAVESLLDASQIQSKQTEQPWKVQLTFEVGYAHQAENIYDRLHNTLGPRCAIQRPRIIKRLIPPGIHHSPEKSPDITSPPTESPRPSDVILYIGGESLGLTNILLTNGTAEVYSYDPRTRNARLESHRSNKLLMRRYAVVQKARDADVFGILVGTLGVASYLPLISHLRTLLRRSHKKSYTVSVGKLNPSKLANFMEIECFVLVACPENSVIDAKEFLRPIVTPFELELALRPELHWTGRYILEFDKLLEESGTEVSNGAETEEDLEDPDRPMFSLVSGKYRQAKQYGNSDGKGSVDRKSSALTLRNQDDALSVYSAGADFLQNRSFRGLEQRLGADTPSILEQGRSGIARGYKDDHT